MMGFWASSGYPYPMISLDPADLSRRIRQHDDDLLSLYELVERLEGKVDTGFARVDTQFSEVNGKLDLLLRRLDRPGE